MTDSRVEALLTAAREVLKVSQYTGLYPESAFVSRDALDSLRAALAGPPTEPASNMYMLKTKIARKLRKQFGMSVDDADDAAQEIAWLLPSSLFRGAPEGDTIKRALWELMVAYHESHGSVNVNDRTRKFWELYDAFLASVATTVVSRGPAPTGPWSARCIGQTWVVETTNLSEYTGYFRHEAQAVAVRDALNAVAGAASPSGEKI